MTSSVVSLLQIQSFLAETSPFDRLSPEALKTLVGKCQLLGYRTGQPIFEREKMPTQLAIVYQGQARVLGYDERLQRFLSIRVVGPKEVLGWAGLIRGIPCETAIASSEVICICLGASDFAETLALEPAFAEGFQEHCSFSEVFELLGRELQRRPDAINVNLKDLTLKVWQDAIVLNIPSGVHRSSDLLTVIDARRTWLLSSGTVGPLSPGSRIILDPASNINIKVEGTKGARILGLLEPDSNFSTDEAFPKAGTPLDISAVPAAPERPPDLITTSPLAKYPVIKAKGPIEVPLACFQMLAKYFGLKFRRDSVKKVLENQWKTVGSISIQACGSIVQMLGLSVQLAQLPASAISRVKAPIMLQWKNGFAVLFSITEKEIVLVAPEEGLIRIKPAQFAEIWGEQGQILLIQQSGVERKEQFSFWWFVPSILEHKNVLIEVLLSSFFIQLFGLAQPIMSQVIIDKVIGQRSMDTLDILGVFMLGIALFEGLLNGLRTFLFVDTTNRIDVKLSAEVIDHLLRLPQGFFDNRRVGDIMFAFGMMSQIREFITGTALTIVLDAVFSVVYIAVMLSYSVPLTAVALGVIPLLAVLMVLVNPILLRLIKQRNARFSDSQSYLVEVVTGIQTVKSQNIELKARWEWSGRYAKFITASFKTLLTGYTSSTISTFFNQVSGLAQLWVGAHLVLANKMTLGQFIAFRIIAGNVTGSLLRFVSVWQQFQEVKMSVEVLRGILDEPTESDEADRNNIPLPEIKGAVRFEDLSFRFRENGPLQLTNINLEFPEGSFVGIVGGSGSGKSTLMKLLQRLYPPLSGRIFIDSYDIGKVELYSIRRQIGVVLQDTLLFNSTVQENIALSNPEATTEEVVRAAKIAVAHDFIMGLPSGYNTVVGERGASLSGGQRQRLAIARTVLQNPNMLILDEATSALDYHSERQVCNNLAEAFKGRTVFFITHRLTTVRNADVIIMMDKGSVVEQGRHDELMALKGRYYCLFQQQEASGA